MLTTEKESAAVENQRGLLLPCPLCGESKATIDLNLADKNLHCQDCDESFSVADVQNLIARWVPVLTWIGQMPWTPEGE